MWKQIIITQKGNLSWQEMKAMPCNMSSTGKLESLGIMHKVESVKKEIFDLLVPDRTFLYSVMHKISRLFSLTVAVVSK